MPDVACAGQECYIAASGVQTARSRLWDDLGPLPWPAGVDGRAISNRFLEQHPLEDLQQARLADTQIVLHSFLPTVALSMHQVVLSPMHVCAVDTLQAAHDNI